VTPHFDDSSAASSEHCNAGLAVARDLYGALDLRQEAERLYVSDFFPNVRPVTAIKLRVRVTQGTVDESSLLISPASQPLVESLSQRELEVLRLLRSGLSGAEIARASSRYAMRVGIRSIRG
jgi:hypothetical protein